MKLVGNEKILFLGASGLGDLVANLGIINALKDAYPGLKIDIRSGNPLAKDLAKLNGNINEALVEKIGSFSLIGYCKYFLRNFLFDLRDIESRKYDLILAVNLNISRRIILLFFSGKTKIIKNDFWFHDVRREYDLLGDFGLSPQPQKSFFLFNIADFKANFPTGIIAADKKNIVFNMFCADSPDSARDWGYWGELIDRVKDKYNIILAGKVDFAYRKFYPLDYSRVIDMINKTDNFFELALLVSKSDLVITIDSFIFHLAYALGKKVVGLFGPVNPEHRIPPLIDRSNIYYFYGDHSGKQQPATVGLIKKKFRSRVNKYTNGISVAAVEDKIKEILN